MKNKTELMQQRRKDLINRLSAGRSPRMQVYVEGAEQILLQFGFDPDDYYFVQENLSLEENKAARLKFHNNKTYRKQRKALGKYTPRAEADANQEAIDRAKRRILIQLHLEEKESA